MEKSVSSYEKKKSVAEAFKGGVIMDVVNADQAKIAEAKAAVAELGALTNAAPEGIAEVQAAVDAMVAAVDAGSELEHKHTGVLNATVARVGAAVVIRINATTKSGRSKMKSFEVA